MGRKRTIDRDKVLDAAETIVAQSGGSGLTIDAVARSAGITKGGVQYAFGNRDALIHAMMSRWWQNYDDEFARIAGEKPGAIGTVRAHIEATHIISPEFNTKAASLLAALTQTPGHLKETREWYRSRIAGLNPDTQAGQQARLAFLAAEGAFLLRFFGFLEITQHEWDNIFSDITALVSNEKSKTDASIRK